MRKQEEVGLATLCPDRAVPAANQTRYYISGILPGMAVLRFRVLDIGFL